MNHPDAPSPHAASTEPGPPAEDERKPLLSPSGGMRAALVALLALHFFAPGPRWSTQEWRWIGLGVPLAAAVVLLLTAGRAFQLAGTGITPFSPAVRLVTTGPYRFSRNPMYLAMVLVTVGAALWCGETTPLLVPPLFWLWLDRAYVVREERFLAQRFGESWERYRSRVRRWL